MSVTVARRAARVSARRATNLALRNLAAGLLAAVCLTLCEPLYAQDAASRWVTDSFEITMRADKNSRAKINRMLRSGTKVEVLEEDRGAGYARVRTSSGAEGWVLTRYLLKRPPARVALPDIERRLQQSDKARADLETENRKLTQEKNALAQQISQAEGTLEGLEKDLSDVRNLSSNAIQIDSQNKDLRRRLTETERLLAELEDENRRLSGQSSREWFIVGAGVVIFGMLLGLIVPRIRWRRKSSWGDF